MSEEQIKLFESEISKEYGKINLLKIKKREGSITIDFLNSKEYPFSVDFLGFQEGSGCPCKDKEEVKNEVEYLKSKYGNSYNLKIIDNRYF